MLFDLARMSTPTTGTGLITLGAAISGFLSFAAAGVPDGAEVTYAIRDGANSEIGRGVYASAGTTLTRSVIKSTNSDLPISLSGTAEVFITPSATDLASARDTRLLYLYAAEAVGDRIGMIDGIAESFSNTDDIALATDAIHEAGKYRNAAGAAETKLLLHFDGPDGSTTTTDSAGSGHSGTFIGDAQIDVAQSKFGGSSLYLDGGGDALSFPASDDFDIGTGDFSVDLWYRPTAKPQTYPRIWQFGSGWGGEAFSLMDRHATYNTKFTVWSFSGGMLLQSTTTVTNGTWYHIEVSRSGSTLRLFVDGVLEDTATFSGSINTDDRDFHIGRANNASDDYCNGHFDEIRLLKGAAGHTAAFTPETQPYSLGSADMDLQSIGFPADLQPEVARVGVQFLPVDSVTVNTDILAYVSRDNGATWTVASLALVDTLAAGVAFYEDRDVPLGGQPAGSNMRWRVQTANGKAVEVHGVILQWS